MVIRNTYNFCRDHGPFTEEGKTGKADCEHVPLPYDSKGYLNQIKQRSELFIFQCLPKRISWKICKDIVEGYMTIPFWNLYVHIQQDIKLDDTEKAELSAYIQNL